MKILSHSISKINGQVTPPSSKSQSIRALIFATLAKGKSVLNNFLVSDDTDSAISICKSLGARISRNGDFLVVESGGVPLENVMGKINAGNSGITTRFIMPVLGLRGNYDQKIILDCDQQMRNRPVEPLIKALTDLGMNIKSVNNNDSLPLEISGKLIGGSVEVDGATSQYVSTLLLSACYAQQDIRVKVKNLNERPYIEMTLKCLGEHGIKYDHQQQNEFDIFTIQAGQKIKLFEKSIPIDFSSASYIIAAAAMIPGVVKIIGVDMSELQGDKRLIHILKEMGADIEIAEDHLMIRGGLPLFGCRIDANDIPDMVPTLAIIGTYAEGKTEIVNVAQARIKETDRIHSMTEGLIKMGADIEEREDGMLISKSRLIGAKVHGYSDHRTIMALSLAGLIADGETEVDTAEGISKTFPNFVELMNKIGCDLKINQ